MQSGPLIQSSVSHDPSEFAVYENFFLLSMLKKFQMPLYSFRILWGIKSSKELHLFKIEIYCDIYCHF